MTVWSSFLVPPHHPTSPFSTKPSLLPDLGFFLDPFFHSQKGTHSECKNRWRFPENYKQGVKKGLLSLTKRSEPGRAGSPHLIPWLELLQVRDAPPSQITGKFELRDNKCYHGRAHDITPPTSTPTLWLSDP